MVRSGKAPFFIRYPLVICHIAMENGHRNSEFSHEKCMVVFHRFLYVYQRVNLHFPMVFLWLYHYNPSLPEGKSGPFSVAGWMLDVFDGNSTISWGYIWMRYNVIYIYIFHIFGYQEIYIYIYHINIWFIWDISKYNMIYIYIYMYIYNVIFKYNEIYIYIYTIFG